MKRKLAYVAVLSVVLLALSSAPASAGVRWVSLTEGMKLAAESHKPVIVDFYTTWCGWCRELDETTYSDPRVIDRLSRDFIAVKVDAEGETGLTYLGRQMTESGFAEYKGVRRYPTIWFCDEYGSTLWGPKSGYRTADQLIKILDEIAGSYAKKRPQSADQPAPVTAAPPAAPEAATEAPAEAQVAEAPKAGAATSQDPNAYYISPSDYDRLMEDPAMQIEIPPEEIPEEYR